MSLSCIVLYVFLTVNVCLDVSVLVQMKAELALQHINSRVVTVADVDASSAMEKDTTLETVWDIKHGYRAAAAAESSQ